MPLYPWVHTNHVQIQACVLQSLSSGLWFLWFIWCNNSHLRTRMNNLLHYTYGWNAHISCLQITQSPVCLCRNQWIIPCKLTLPKNPISLQKAQIKQRHKVQVKTEMTHPWYPFQMSQPMGSWRAKREDGNDTKGGSVWTTANWAVPKSAKPWIFSWDRRVCPSRTVTGNPTLLDMVGSSHL